MANAGGIRAGRAYVEVGTDETSLEKGLRSAESKVKAFGQSITSIGAKISGIGAAITAPIIAASKVFADGGSALLNMSARTGVAVETLSTLGFAAQQTGADLGSVEVGIRKMQKSLLAGSEENLQAEATFQALGLAVRDLIRMSPDQQFYAIAKSIAAIRNPTAKGAIAMTIFGRSGEELVPLIDNLEELTGRAKEFGLVATTQGVESAHRFEQSIGILAATMKKIISTIGSAVAPQFMEFNLMLARGMKTIKEFVAANKPLVLTVYRIGLGITIAGAAITALGIAISAGGAALGVMASVVGGLVTVFGALTSPITLVVAGLAALTAWFVTSTTTGQEALASLGGGFQSLKETAVQAFKGIGDALRAGDIGLAGQILWAGLKVEFLKGINYLKGLWADWGTASIEVFRGVSFGIARAFTDTWAAIQSGFVNALATMRVSFTNFSSFLMKAWNNIGGFFAVVWEKIKALFKGGDIEAEVKRINEQTAAANAEQEKKRSETVGGINAGRAEQLKGIEGNRQEAGAALTDQQQSEIDARRKAAQEGLASDAAALKAAQDELSGLVGKAGKEAAAAAVVPKLKKAGAPGLPEIGEAVQAAKAKIDVAGTFSAAATRGLGVGSTIQDEQLKEQKAATKHLEQLNHKADVGRLVFS